MADNDTNLIPEGPENVWTPDPNDRRRLVVEGVLLEIERGGGMVYPIQFGQVVLNNVISEDEIVPMSEAADRSLVARLMARGLL